MKRMILGMVLIVLAIGGMFFWETAGREMFLYDEVLTVTQDVEESTIISEEMLALKRVAKATPGALTKKDVSNVLGKEATQFIPAQTEVFEQYFADSKLVVHAEDNEYVLSIPNKWLESYPQSLRRGDQVYFWCEGTKVTSATVVYVKDSSNTEVTSDEDRLTASSNVSLVEIIATEKQADLLSTYAKEGKKFVILYN